jgi:uncharacterized membrane protein YeaQ/YmgE (transglycosylase-associated protein family)
MCACAQTIADSGDENQFVSSRLLLQDGNLNRGEHPMNIIIWLAVGGIIGWLASIFMKTDGQQGIILNVVVGIVGAMLAGWFLSPVVGVGTINDSNFSLPALIVSFVGAVMLLALMGVLRRGNTR